MKKKTLHNFVKKLKPLSFIFSLHFKDHGQRFSKKSFSLKHEKLCSLSVSVPNNIVSYKI